ncbi:ABC-type polysaccharide/polyol phosphate transport system ATPase subunit [Paenibacillus anaericanus]|uniref:ATP-binding cassette domain-containing protein n=1 Tax=Paenibacillus anaericanus TaxID=170367 RepID=UPI00277D55E5|nr:ATP-binding cassette domain-containing protein [Paenibacillus anaericanus]MDQ0089968.1 ABC-type polysaccharide/polyol phosphate transport system ATPase subunit [Paenibacillus anaericanus]
MIELNNVSMKFRMANDRIMSLKEYVVKKLTGKIEYKEFVALNNVSFSIKKGEVVGIIGSNGAGKSTLLKIISGILAPTQGNMRVQGSIAPMLELGAGFDVDLTARENIFLNGAVLGYSKQYLTDKYDEIVDFSELHQFMNVPIRNFSSGMIMRLAFSIATLVNPDVLIVDEILSVGDANFQKKSAKRMRELMSGGTTVIMVSHSIEQIRQMCSRAVWLDHGELKMVGNAAEVCNAYMNHSRELYTSQNKITSNSDDMLIYKRKLYSPTFIAKFDDLYFIVDCWHHRVIYNDNLLDEVRHWETMDETLNNPHSIATDGSVLLVEDTDNDRVKVFKRKGSSFVETQSITGIGRQPHKIVYDNKHNRFYGIAASTQQLFVLKNTGEEVIVEKVVKLDYLGHAYIRSITLIDEKIYFVSGPGKIIVANPADLSFDLISEYEVPFELQGMNDIVKIGSYYYLSVYQNGAGDIDPSLIRVKDLNYLETTYEDINDQLNVKGVPYNFSFIDDRVFLTEIDSYSAIKSFKVINDTICDLQVHFDMGVPDMHSLNRRDTR